MNPLSRSNNLSVTAEGNKLLIRDLLGGDEYRLEGTYLRVWKLLDGSRSVKDIVDTLDADGLKVSVKEVWEVLDSLADAELLAHRISPPTQAPSQNKKTGLRITSRRKLVAQFASGFVGAMVIQPLSAMAQTEQASKEQASKQGSQEQATKEQASKEQSGKQGGDQEQASKEQAGKQDSQEQASKEQASKQGNQEQTTKEQTSKEQSGKQGGDQEQVSKEQTSKQGGNQEQLSKEQASKQGGQEQSQKGEQISKQPPTTEIPEPSLSVGGFAAVAAGGLYLWHKNRSKGQSNLNGLATDQPDQSSQSED